MAAVHQSVERAGGREIQLDATLDRSEGSVAAATPGHVEAVRRHVFDPLTTSQAG